MTVKIAIDVMGGDHGLRVTIPSALRILRHYPTVKLFLVGDESRILDHLKGLKEPALKQRINIHHSSEVVEMNESPVAALRNKKDSSMRIALDLLKAGVVDACVSAGNTGALMMTAKFVLKMIDGVARPAIATFFPTNIDGQEVLMLDLGANVDATAEQLFQFSIMGSLVAEQFMHKKTPRVALLNIGEEEIKGNEVVKKTHGLLSSYQASYQNSQQATHAFNYIGHIEGNEIFSGKADVIVCDGFVGNIALKTGEGIVQMMASQMRRSFSRNWITKAIAAIAKPVIRSAFMRFDPSVRNGATLLGVQGIVIKSHGGADRRAFIHAIEEAIREVDNQLTSQIQQRIPIVLQDAGELIGE